MLSGLEFLLALLAVLAVLFWSIKFDSKESVPQRGLFGIRLN